MSNPATARDPDPSRERESARPSVDVVVPFAGPEDELEAVCDRVARLQLRAGDSLRVVDNTRGRGSVARGSSAVEVIRADELPTPAHARNQGAMRGAAEWLVFIDADAVPANDLLDRYFSPEPGPRTGLIGGGVTDEQVASDAPAVARYTQLRRSMSQERTFEFGEWGYPKSANIACRRSAFEAVGGFREEIRAGEDADLTYRLRAEGWQVERREHANVIHLSRSTLRGLIKQQLLWGAGGAWLARTYPGSVPLADGPGLAWWAAREAVRGVLRARGRGRDQTVYALLRPVEALAWQCGRVLSNERTVGHGRIRKPSRPAR